MTWVLYKDILHTIVHDYQNGLVEIREINGYRVTLVEKKEIEIVVKSKGC